MTRPRRTQAELRAGMAQAANRTRATADEMAASLGGCDDPLYPPMLTAEGQTFRDYLDFVDRVARPLVEAESDEEAQAAMALYRKTSPYFICTALVMSVLREADRGPS